MPGTEIVRKQTTWGGAAGIALLGFALVYRFFPDLIHVEPGRRVAAPPTAATSAPPPPIGAWPISSACRTSATNSRRCASA